MCVHNWFLEKCLRGGGYFFNESPRFPHDIQELANTNKLLLTRDEKLLQLDAMHLFDFFQFFVLTLPLARQPFGVMKSTLDHGVKLAGALLGALPPLQPGD